MTCTEWGQPGLNSLNTNCLIIFIWEKVESYIQSEDKSGVGKLRPAALFCASRKSL